MKPLLISCMTIGLMTGAALAGGKHEGGHDDEMTIGKAGKKASVMRTVKISMHENEDGSMSFTPPSLNFKQGETVRLSFVNKGEGDHEFVMDEHKAIMEHKEVMERYPDMEHADSNSIRLEPGKSGEIIWNFANAGKFEFACLIPGHFEAGMKGTLAVEASH